MGEFPGLDVSGQLNPSAGRLPFLDRELIAECISIGKGIVSLIPFGNAASGLVFAGNTLPHLDFPSGIVP